MQTTSLEELIARGTAALSAQDMKSAEQYFRQAVSLAPENAVALHNTALVLFRTGRRAEAEPLLKTALALKTGAAPESFILMGEIHEANGRHAEALRLYQTLVNAVPKHVDGLLKLGTLRDAAGDKPGAIDCYRRAAEAAPTHLMAVMKYCEAIWVGAPAKSVEMQERLLTAIGDKPRQRMAVLGTLVVHKEWNERIKRGLMPAHADSVDELFYNFARPEMVAYEEAARLSYESNPADGNARVGLGLARFCLGDRQGAEPLLRENAKPDHILQAVRSGPAYYDTLRGFSDEKLLEGLPPLIDVTPLAPAPGGVLYLSCNYTYFRAFALPMVCSLREQSPDIPVHLHIMDADDAQAAFAVDFCRALGLERFAVSVERPGLEKASGVAARCYYHAVRFIRFYQHLKAYGCPLWLMDVDAVVHRDLAPLFDRVTDNDVAMRIRPGRLEPWNQFNACVVGASTTARSLEYFRLLAAYVAEFHQRGALAWGIDQLAMYGVYADMADRGEAPTLSLLGEREVDYEYRDDGFIWCNSGIGKFKHLKRIANPASMPMADFGDNKFIPVFEKHWRETERIAQSLSPQAPGK